jgi:hypothetical protein
METQFAAGELHVNLKMFLFTFFSFTLYALSRCRALPFPNIGYTSVCLSVCLSIYISICLSACLSGVCLSIYLVSACLSMYLYSHPCVCLSISLLACLSVYVSINQSLSGSTPLCWNLPAFLVSWFTFTIVRTPLTGDQPVARPLPVHRRA